LEGQQVEQRIAMLGQHDRCPLCDQLLGTDGLSAAQSRLTDELHGVERRLRDVRADYGHLADSVKAAQKAVQEIEARLAERPAAERALGQFGNRPAPADPARNTVDE